MRDIRGDLRERLEYIARERARLDEAETGIKTLLQQEEQRLGVSSSNGNGHVDTTSEGGNTPLARLIITTLRQAKRSLTVEEFKEAAKREHFDFGEKSPGRVIHWALVGMAQGETVEKVGDRWRIVVKEVAQ